MSAAPLRALARTRALAVRAALAASLAASLVACDDATAPDTAPARYDLVFTARSRGFDELHRVTPGAAATRLFAGDAERNASFPAASPDGRRVAYLDLRDDEVWIEDLATGARVNVSNFADDLDYMPAWSPDGARLAFASARTGAFDVYVVNADGTGLRRLTVDASPAVHHDRMPAWSPDGSRIAFASDRGGTTQIWTMRADGTDLRQVTTDPTSRAYEPDWSPDGARLVFRRTRSAGAAGVATDLAIVGADGAGLVDLPLPGAETSPAWSPDGARIAFASNLPGTDTRLYTVRPDGTGLVEVAGGPALGHHVAHPRWLRRR